MAERSRIATFFVPLCEAEPGSFSLTDDAAVLNVPAGKQLVITTDSVIESIHVLREATPQQCAQKLMRRNLSDLAAMGANPWRYSLNLHTPHGLDDTWFATFAATLADEQARFGITLIGGDSTSGGELIHTTITCYGLMDGAPLRRNGAKIGDDVYVSGTLGGAAYALSFLQHKLPCDDVLAAAYHCPQPRLALGMALRGVATSAMDISDGLIADVQQLCAASRCSAQLQLSSIPLSVYLKNAALDAAAKHAFALSGGDDYELLFTAPVTSRDVIDNLASTLHLPLTRIGSVRDGSSVTLLDEAGNSLPITQQGWEHQ